MRAVDRWSLLWVLRGLARQTSHPTGELGRADRSPMHATKTPPYPVPFPRRGEGTRSGAAQFPLRLRDSALCSSSREAATATRTSSDIVGEPLRALAVLRICDK